jgi:hypothetical protein
MFETTPLDDPEFLRQSLVRKINLHLSSGGLFNPELADHHKVTELLIEIRDYLQRVNHEKATRNTGIDQ